MEGRGAAVVMSSACLALSALGFFSFFGIWWV
jgi:hypothetical protein